MQRLDVLPAFLQQRHQEVDGHIEVLPDIFRGEFSGSHGGAHTQHFFQLEFDGLLDFVAFGLHGLAFRDAEREFPDFHESIAQKLGNLLHQRLGGEESIVRFRPTFDQLLFFVEFLEAFHVNAVDVRFACVVTVSRRADDSDLRESGKDLMSF